MLTRRTFLASTLAAPCLAAPAAADPLKVRDLYQVGEDLLIVATDRISAFDYILPTPVPGKGKVLNQVAAFWFDPRLIWDPPSSQQPNQGNDGE